MSINIAKIQEILIEKGISYTELSKLTGISKTHISRIINGKTTRVRTTTINKLAKALDKNGNDLLEGDERI